jgi:3-oxoadipate enol-lactonase
MRLDLPTTSIEYFRSGETGERVLLVMGLGASASGWRPLVERLEADHQVAWFDNRGVAGSAPLQGPTSMGEMAGDTLALADHLGWDSFHLVGISMGGMVAQHVALAAPERLASLTLMVTTPYGRSTLWPPPPTLALLLRTQLGSRASRFRALARLLVHPDRLREQGIEHFVAQFDGTFGLAHKGTLRAQRQAVADHDVRGRLGPTSGVRTLLVGALADRLVPPSQTSALGREMPHAELVWLDAGHRVHADRPEQLATAVRAHIAGPQ